VAKVDTEEEETSVVAKTSGAVGGFFAPMVGYLRDTRAELRKVTWPTRQEALNLTLLVLGVMVFMSLVLGSLDLLYARLLEQLFTFVPGG